MAPATPGTVSLPPILGHEATRDDLSGAYRAGRLPASLLIHGRRGVGKQRLALWISQMLVCEASDRAPCAACPSCRMAGSIEHPDVHWYFPLERPKGVSGERLADALEEARLEEIAEVRAHPVRASHSGAVKGLYLGSIQGLRARATRRPVMAPGPVFVIGDADLLVPQESSPEAANALLKLLEEPPGATRFILTTSEPGRILPTIRSRTVPLHLAPLPSGIIESFLIEHAGVDDETATWAARLGQGSPGRALGFLPSEGALGSLEELRRRAFEIVASALAGNGAKGHALALSFSSGGARGLMDLFAFLEEWLRDLAAVASGVPERVLNHDAVDGLRRRAQDFELNAYDVARSFQAVDRARHLARANVNPQLVIGSLVRELRKTLRNTSTAGAGA